MALAAFAACLLLNPAQGATGRFVDSEGNVREQPDTKAKLLFTSKAGEEFTVIERLGAKWVRVKLKDGRSGWTNIVNVKLDATAATKSVEKAPEPAPVMAAPVSTPSQATVSAGSDSSLREENDRLKQEIARLEQEKMLVESGSSQSQFTIDKLKEELRQMTAIKEQLEAEVRELKKTAGN